MRPYVRYIRTYEIRFSKWSSRGLVAVVPPLYRRFYRRSVGVESAVNGGKNGGKLAALDPCLLCRHCQSNMELRPAVPAKTSAANMLGRAPELVLHQLA